MPSQDGSWFLERETMALDLLVRDHASREVGLSIGRLSAIGIC